MKPKKGKQQQETVRSNLAHILGYTGTDMDLVGPPSPAGSEKEAAGLHACYAILHAVLHQVAYVKHVGASCWNCSTA